MVEKIFKLMEKEGINATNLSRVTGISTTTFSQWKKGLQKPSTEAIVKLADYFNVTTDYIIRGGEKNFNSTIHAINGVGVVGQDNAVTVNGNGNEGQQDLSTEATELLKIYNRLDVKNRMKLLQSAFDIEEEFSEVNPK